jgi:hypothetical protein
VPVLLKAGADNARGEVSLQLPKGWKSEPAAVPFSLAKAEEEKRVLFKVTPPGNASEAVIKAVVKTADGNTLGRGLLTIDHAHIPRQTLFPAAEVRAVRPRREDRGQAHRLPDGGRRRGARRPAPDRLLGDHARRRRPEGRTGAAGQVRRHCAGRAGLQHPQFLRFYNQTLFKYAENGGVVVVQYTVSRPLVTEQLGPYPFELSRDRVTVEEAPVTFREPGHQVFNRPTRSRRRTLRAGCRNAALYFAQKWDAKYLALLSSTDPGEKPQDGGLLVAPHGQGKFVYTGYAFFRQLPAGVPGAYRLFANLLAK